MVIRQNAYVYCIKLLTKRDYSKVKLIQKLQNKGYEESEIEDAINEVVKRNYLREDYYIESRIKGLMHKYYSPEFIQNRLREESLEISIEQIEDIFSDNGNSTQQQIEKLIHKKIPQIIPEDEQSLIKLKQKIIRHLISKGHSISDSKQLVKDEFDRLQQAP